MVSDYLDRYGKIDAVWMDAGGIAVTVLEAFKDAGSPYPKVMVGEDQNDYLKYWKENNVNAVAPTFPTFQWRTAVLRGRQDPARARLSITAGYCLSQMSIQANLDQYYRPRQCPRCTMH